MQRGGPSWWLVTLILALGVVYFARQAVQSSDIGAVTGHALFALTLLTFLLWGILDPKGYSKEPPK